MTHNHIHVDPTLPLLRQSDKGHNRWHPDIAPAIRIASGTSVGMETLDGLDLSDVEGGDFVANLASNFVDGLAAGFNG